MKVYIDKFKELWKIKRYRSILVLLLYFIFFIFVFAYISEQNKVIAPSKPVEEKLTGLDYFKTINSYSYEINGLYNFKVLVGDTTTISYNNQIYNVDELPELGIYDFSIYNPKTIYKIIKNSSLAVTDYINNTNTYIISNIEFNKLIYNQEVVDDYDIKIITTSLNENINKIEIDFATYTLLLETE